MIKTKHIFTVSLIAVIIAGMGLDPVHASIAAKTYVDSMIKGIDTDVSNKVTKNADIVAGTGTKITYDTKGLVTGSSALVAGDIPTIPTSKVSGLGTMATKNSVTSADITDGTITNADISATATIAKTKLASDVQTSLGKADTALQTADVAGKENTSNKTTTISAVATASDTKYPSEKAVATGLAGKADSSVVTALTTTVNNKADAVVVTGAGNGTKVTVNAQGIVTDKGTAGVADINGLQGALDLKANQATTYTKTEVDTALGKKANATVTDALTTRVTTVEGNITNLQTNKQDKLTQAANAGDNITVDANGKISATVPDVSEFATTSALTTGLAGKEDVSNKTTTISAATTASDVKYPSEKAVATAIAAKANVADVSAKLDKNADIVAGTGTKITYDAKGLVTGSSALIADDIPTISTTKVSGLGALATKDEITSEDITDGTVTDSDISDTAAIAKTKLASDVQTSLGKADTALQTLSTSGSGAVVTGVSGGDLVMGNVQIPFGSATSTSYVSIWVE
ncbi:hypothetical protein LJC18_03440 [Lachnospiraceae bacterium OttesenSCG-928-E19]|nr:hypothetical protein [Lachnospiraceae bacterium OttesenSCG-928-E19]